MVVLTLLDYQSNKIGLATIILATAVILMIVKRILTHHLDPQRKIPGPFWARYTRLWLFMSMVSLQSARIILEQHRKHGRVIRIAPNVFSIADPEVIREIHSPSNRKPYEKSAWYSTFTSPGGVTLIANQNNSIHGSIRRKFAHSFSMTETVKLDEQLDETVSDLLDRFGEVSKTDQVSDMGKWLKLFVLDGNLRMVFGENAGALRTGTDALRLMTITRASVHYGSMMGVYPEWHSWLWRIFPESLLGEKGARVYSASQLEKLDAQKEKDGTPCLVNTWLRQKEEDSMTREDVRMGIGACLGAAESPLPFISASLFHVFKNQSILQRLRQELDTAIQETPETHGNVSHKMIAKMPYLQAVLKEAMRLYPPAGVILPRSVPKGGAFLAGYQFREGQTIGVNHWFYENDEKHFGRNPSEFRPDRWLDDEEEAKLVTKYSLPWSIGSRECIGKHLVSLMMRKVVARVIYEFDLHDLPDELDRWNDFTSGIHTFNCRVTKRGAEPSSVAA